MWHDVDERQFYAQPFYENDDRTGKPHYAMYGRALSDGRFYPNPPTMYHLTLTECGAEADGESSTDGRRGHTDTCHSPSLSRCSESGRWRQGKMRGATSSVISKSRGQSHPNFISPEDPEQQHGREPTVFYPDTRLRSREPFGLHVDQFQFREYPCERRPIMQRIKSRLFKLNFAPFSSRSASGAHRQRSGIGPQHHSETASRGRGRQAGAGEVAAGGAATHTHGDEAAEEVVADVRDAIRNMIKYHLLPATTGQLLWTGHNFPGIANPEILEGEAEFWRQGKTKLRHLLDDISQQTAVEAGDGHFPGVQSHGRSGRLATPQQLVAVFDESIMPAALQPGTRTGYQGAWKWCSLGQ